MSGRAGRRAAMAALAVAACYALPALLVTSGGVVATIAGGALRLWPLTFVGIAVFVWGVARLRSVRRSRRDAASPDTPSARPEPQP